MQKLLFPILFVLPLFAEVEYKGNLGFEADYFEHDLYDKRDNAFALRGEFEA